jgi:hypothetical protein
MKRVLLLIFFTFSICNVASANTFQQSMAGKVDTVTTDDITVAQRVYKFTPKTTFRAYEKRGDSIYEVQIEKSDIRPGQYVVVMAQATTALQVIIERWRQ